MEDKKATVPQEFDLVPHHGFTMRGWDFSSVEIADAIHQHRLLNPAIELCSNACPWNCAFCFTEDPANPGGGKRRLPGELDVERRLLLIDEAADLGARSINIVGAGEPTIDRDFERLVERIAARRMTPIVYSEASLRLRDVALVRSLYSLGATVVVKVNSLWNEEYQNDIVRGSRPAERSSGSYFQARNEAIETLLAAGFAEEVPTRLAFDTIVCRQNVTEIEQLHRFARTRNIFPLFVGYMPTGRAKTGPFDALSSTELFSVFERMRQIDVAEYGLSHNANFPYGGGVPCSIRGLGLFVKIQGEVFDCPGTTESLGDVRRSSLAEIWNRARHITQGFDGLCLPRKLYWEAKERR